MGASNSRLEEDKSLQLCRARKKFIKQALNGRCSLAAAHIAYIEELRSVGAALRRFVEFDAQVEHFAHSSRSPTPEPQSLKSVSRLSFSSRSLSQHVDTTANLSPPSSTPVSSRYQSHYMKFRGTFSTKVEEKPHVPVAVSVSSTTPPTATPRSTEAPEESQFETAVTPENSPWDYFGLFHPIDQHFSSQQGQHFSSQQGQGFDQGSENSDEIRYLRVEAGVHEIKDTEEKLSSDGIEDSQISDDEFDEPSSATLVQSFKNVNRSKINVVKEDSSSTFSEKRVSETKFSSSENVNQAKENLGNGVSPHRPSEISETKFMNGKNNNSPDLSPLRATSSRFVHLNDVKITPMKQSEAEDQVAPNDFFSSMKAIEQLFATASESGKEVPRMLEANKFHFRPVVPGKEGGSVTSSLLKSCFSCGEDPSEISRDPPQDSVKYLTWHRTTSSRSASSRNLLGANSIDAAEEPTQNLFDNFCMVSGSHASTLDRLYAWEKKLYDEVKAGQVLRSNFDQKCKLLRQQESRGENTDKTRAAVKGLHSRIRVAIQRIDSISKKIEEIRDKELQPQLEELIEGLRKMWEMMVESHKLQFHIISVSHAPRSTKITVQSDSRRQITIHLEHVLSSLSSSFTKWVSAQKLYVESIDKWLFKCVLLPQNPSKRNKRMRPPPIRNTGPPIYMICGAWLEMIDKLPCKGVVNSIKDLEAEVAHFLPRQEKSQGKGGNHGDHGMTTMLRDEDLIPALDRFRTSLAGFLGQLNNFAESSLSMFADLQKTIQEAKSNYEQPKSQQS
ncbi:bZIP transcription factor [Perilla frutescens var. hirtella]|nr:bZIP transcription factor [Perilla frutescens var. hirtella]